MKTIEEKVYEIVLPFADQLELEIYDIVYAKQGKEMYLSIYIDNKNGVSINDCENLSRLIENPVDENIEFKESYCLEVSSAGIERNIRTEEHLKKYLNTEISISLFKPLDENKKMQGILLKYTNNDISILSADKEYLINRKNISQIKTVFNWNNIKEEDD